MTTFIRFMRGETLDEATLAAQADLERGYSIRGYQLFDSREQAAESLFVEAGADVDDLVVVDGRFGFALPGLCGYEFDADEQSPRDFPYADVHDFYAVYEGRYAGQADAEDGDVFKPTTLLSVAAL